MAFRFLAIAVLSCSLSHFVFGSDGAASKLQTPVKIAVVKDSGGWGSPIGNVRVTFKNRTQAIWSKGRNSGMARIADDGTVGWVNFTDLEPSEYRPGTKERFNGSISICRNGKIVCTVSSSLLWIEQWRFVDGGRRFVVGSMLRHGAMTYDLFDSRTGRKIAEYRESDESTKWPEWASMYRQE
jgi:hypothetical protein